MSNGNNFHFTFNFHGPVGQQISHVEKLETHFDKDMSMQVIDTGAVMNEEEPLRNYIFLERIFNTNEHLIRLRNTIASAIDMGEETARYGTPQEKRIHPHARNEWYYIVKAIEESEISKPFAITHFVEQMMEWYPHLFPSALGEERESVKRRLSKAISEEKGLWKHGKMKEVISLGDMWAKRNLLALDPAKMERIYAIAYKGLYQNLKDLK
ncbi:MAG: hypothetical protein IKW43_00335 [Bacteroidaceae bacterium]|nr:hypothetical protein [Bacteroidaceae bacterium]